MRENKFLGRFIYFGGFSFIAGAFGLFKLLKTRNEGVEFLIGGFMMLLIVYLYDWLNKKGEKKDVQPK